MALIDNVKGLIEVAKEYGDEKTVEVGLFLKQRLANPDSYVVFLGETCSGKSTLINSFLGEGVLPVSAVPSTGTITEVLLDKEADAKRYNVINRNATMEAVDYKTFASLAIEPDDMVKRLRVTMPAGEKNLSGVHVFDTPGYGSMIEEHEDILLDFLAESDAIIYTVGYRAGFQMQDYEFLGKVLGILRGGIPFYLVVNRCPEGVDSDDKRVREIYDNTKALLRELELPLYVVPNVDEGQLYNIAQVKRLFEDVRKNLTGEERQAELQRAFEMFTDEYFEMVKAPIEIRYEQSLRTKEELEFLRNEAEEASVKIRGGIKTIVEPGFVKIKESLPKWVNGHAENVRKVVHSAIDKEDTFKGDETKAYVGNHLVRFNLDRASGEIQENLAIALSEIEEQISRLMNKTVVEFEKDIQLKFDSKLERVAANMGKNAAGRAMNGALLSYFAKFGGAGKAGAGVANAASHMLKKVGDFFGKKFSRETHNALKHFLAKIGATSVKAVSVVVSVVIELAIAGWDLVTWKPKLKKAADKSINDWKSDIVEIIGKDLDELKKENVKMLNNVADEWLKMAPDDNEEVDCEKFKKLMEKLDEIEKR